MKDFTNIVENVSPIKYAYKMDSVKNSKHSPKAVDNHMIAPGSPHIYIDDRAV